MLGGNEWLIVLIAAGLLLFGSKKMPEFARSLGKAIAEFKRGRLLVERELNLEFGDVAGGRKEVRMRRLKTGSADKRKRLVEIARNLGIQTKGKTNKVLKEEIDRALT